MKKVVRFIAQYVDADSGDLIEEAVIKEDVLSKAETLKGLGYTHIEQIDFLQKIQDFKIKHQIILNAVSTCPTCACKTKKVGVFKSKFHAVLTDHRVGLQRTHCNCGWYSPTSVEGLFGSNIHPDLLKKQAALTAEKSYVKASKELNYDAEKNRVINNRTNLSRVSNLVSKTIESIQTEDRKVADSGAKELICTIDGGHIKKRGEGRSFEAMIATVYKPESIKKVDKNHQKIIDKRIIASSKNDSQQNIKKTIS